MVEITNKTKLNDLIDEYPFIVDELPKINNKFRILSSPVGKIMRDKVDIDEMSRRSGLGSDEIISMLTEIIESH